MGEMTDRNDLIPLYAQMADLTKPECRKCRRPHGCCNKGECLDTIAFAKEFWNIDLPMTENADIPLLGSDNSCSVPPHLRPICTVHTCQISGLGTSGDQEWDAKYFSLREQIADMEFEIFSRVNFPDD